ncbi:hypothetical protein [Sphingobacterium hotanense]|uniref:hypothetical protein n=1 Tax=Sphingobacterium hotanense TaxID=649196 RepID=UPI0021A30D81|nr:hypothetical protein [Sphingobacterium hotanense]MCT1523885.1 hypothetical protein [Sphingobacterium hotanense]
MRPLLLIIALLTFINCHAQTQTSGLSYVNSIESKVIQYEKNKDRIAQLKRDLPALEEKWRMKKQEITDKINALVRERDALVGDMKVGARCSECNRWKTDLEKIGIDFEEHLGEVKGYAIPATTAELENVRKQYNEKIAIQKVQLQRIQNTDEFIQANLLETDKLTKNNVSLCEEVTKLSKNYETTVLQEAQNKQEVLIRKLCDVASDILIANDQIEINKARIIRYNDAFRAESEKVKNRIETETKELQEFKNQEIVANEKRIESKQYQMDTAAASKIEQSLALAKSLAAEIEDLKSKNRGLNLEISYLSEGLEKKIQDKTMEIKPQFDSNIAATNSSTQKANERINLLKQQFESEINAATKTITAFMNVIISETNRMVMASRKIECSVWNNTAGEATSNWNQVTPCIRNLTSTTQINPYCSKWNLISYLGKYKSFLASLPAEDLAHSKNALLNN